MEMTAASSSSRRSERTKNLSSSPPSDPSPSTSKSSGSNKRITAKQLGFEANDASEDEENDAGTSNLKVKKMDARTYRATFKRQNTDCHEESNRTDRSTPEDCNRGGGKIDGCFKGNSSNHKAVSKDGILPSEDAKAKDMGDESRLRGPMKELLENNVTLGSLVPSNATTHETIGAPERLQSDCHGEETSLMLPCNATIQETSGASERVQSDCRGEKTPQILASRNSYLNENLIRKCVGHDKGETLTSSKRKRTVADKYSDISATSVDDDNCNLIMDAGSPRLCSDIVETSGPCSKRIRRISLSDVQRDRRKLINNVDQPSSKTIDEILSARNKEGKSGDSVERPQGNNVETEKIRKQQRSLHLSLKPEIAKLCEILLLPDNVKSMVENCLEYTMNNYQICTEPISTLQAFQLSLCWTAASLLKHKFDVEASLMLAKRHLDFDCKKDVVDEIYSRLWDLKDNFLLVTGNSKVIGSPKASESSNRVSSNTEVTPEVELTNRDISKNIKEIQKHKNQWRELLRMQREKKQKLEKDIETEEADFVRRYFVRRYKMEWASSSPNDAMSKEKLKVFNGEYDKRIGELKRKRVWLKDLETKQLEARQKFRESWAPVELLNLDVSKETETPHNASKALLSGHVAEGKSFDNIVEAMRRNGTGVGFSEAPNTNSSVVVSRSSPVELQTPLVKHASVNEMDIMASKHGPVPGNKCHVIAENEYGSQDNFLLVTGNSKVIGSPKASESSNRVSSNTEVTPEVELTNRDISKNIKEIQKHKNQWRELLRMQREKKQKLEKDIETEEADFVRRYFVRRYKMEWASSSPNDAMSKEKLKVFNGEYDKRIGELKRKRVWLKDLETKQLEARQKFRESWAPVELLNLDVSKEIGTPHNASKALLSGHVAEGKSFDNIVEAMRRNGTGVGFSEAPNTNSSVVVSCSSPVELQTPVIKHASVNEMDIMASKDGPVSGNKCHVIAENEYGSQDNFLLVTGNSKVIGSPKASESSSRVSSNTEVTPEVELTTRDISKNIKEIQKHKNQWRELLRMQREKKQQLEKDIETEEADFVRRYFVRRYKIEWASSSPNDAMSKEKLKVFNSEYDKRIGELKRKRVWLKDLETKELEARQKFRESWAPVELLNLDVSKETETPHNASKALLSGHVAEGKSFDNIVEAMRRNGTGVGFSEAPNTNSSVVVSRSSPVELQTPLVKHASVNEMDIMASKHGSVPGNKCHVITENEYDSQGNIITEHSNSRDQCSNGATGMADEGEGCENFSRKSPNDRGQDAVTLVLPSSNGELCGGETSDVPSGEVVLAVHKTSSSKHDQVEIPSSRQGKFDGTIFSEPVCGLSTVVKANGSIDGVKIMDSLNSQSPEEHILSVSTMCMQNCKNAAQIPGADDGSGSNNADTLNSPSSDENSKSPQEHVHSVNVMCMRNCAFSAEVCEDDDGNGLNNVVTLNSPLNDDRSADGNVLDREVHLEMPRTVNFTPSSMDQISGGAVSVSVLDSVLSRPCGTASPSNSSDANAIILLNQPSLEKQNPNGVSSSSYPAGQNPVEVSETSHKCATASELNREEAVGMPGTVGSTDYPENATPLNSSSTDQISEGGPVLDEALSLRPCSSSRPRNGRPATISLLNRPSLKQQVPDRVLSTITHGQIPVVVPENCHEEAECQLKDCVVADKSTAPDHHEGVRRTMTENTLSQETPVSRPVDLIEPHEHVQPLSSAESPPDQDTVEEMHSSLVSSPVNILPANQSNHVSMVMEPPEQVQRLPSSGFLSSNWDLSNLPLVTGIEDQATNGDAPSSHIPEASIEVQNQAIEQPASNLVVDSHSRQFVPRVLNSALVSPVPGGVRTQSSDTRNLSTSGVIDNHPIQTATQSASRIVPPSCHDPLSHELERICKLAEQNMKNHEDMNLQLNCDYEKELEELHRKYDNKLSEIEVEFQKARKNQDTHLNRVYVNKILADLFRAKSEVKVCGASGMQQDAGFAPGSQTMVPPIQPTSNTSGIFCGVPARLPHINSISSPLVNLQAVGKIRAPAPHLQPYRPSSSFPPSSLCTVPPGMPSHPAPSNTSASSASFSHWLPRPTPTISRSDPHRGHWPENTGGFPIPNLSAMDLRGDANSQSSQATSPNVVCLSDDD